MGEVGKVLRYCREAGASFAGASGEILEVVIEAVIEGEEVGVRSRVQVMCRCGIGWNAWCLENHSVPGINIVLVFKVLLVAAVQSDIDH